MPITSSGSDFNYVRFIFSPTLEQKTYESYSCLLKNLLSQIICTTTFSSLKNLWLILFRYCDEVRKFLLNHSFQFFQRLLISNPPNSSSFAEVLNINFNSIVTINIVLCLSYKCFRYVFFIVVVKIFHKKQTNFQLVM